MSDDVVAFLRAAHEEIEAHENGKRTLVARPTCPECGRNASEFSFDGSGSYDLRCGDTVAVTTFWERNGEATRDRGALARVQAERAIVDEHEVWASMARNGPAVVGADLLRGVVRMLAYGHRHTVPGWREEWAPEGVTADAR